MISDGQEFGRGLSVLPTSIVAQTVKRLSAMRETCIRFLGQEDPLEKEMATHSSTLAWKIPWMKEPGRLQSMGSQRVGHNWVTSLSLFFLSVYLNLWSIVISSPFINGLSRLFLLLHQQSISVSGHVLINVTLYFSQNFLFIHISNLQRTLSIFFLYFMCVRLRVCVCVC